MVEPFDQEILRVPTEVDIDNAKRLVSESMEEASCLEGEAAPLNGDATVGLHDPFGPSQQRPSVPPAAVPTVHPEPFERHDLDRRAGDQAADKASDVVA